MHGTLWLRAQSRVAATEGTGNRHASVAIGTERNRRCRYMTDSAAASRTLWGMFAVSVEIHAALVGGALSGVVVLMGVIPRRVDLTSWTALGADIVRATHSVARYLPVVLVYLHEDPARPPPHGTWVVRLATRTGSTYEPCRDRRSHTTSVHLASRVDPKSSRPDHGSSPCCKCSST